MEEEDCDGIVAKRSDGVDGVFACDEIPASWSGVMFEIRFGGSGNKGLHSMPSLLSDVGDDDPAVVSEAVTWDADMTFGSRHTFDARDATKAITSGFHIKKYCRLYDMPKVYYLISISGYLAFIR